MHRPVSSEYNPIAMPVPLGVCHARSKERIDRGKAGERERECIEGTIIRYWGKNMIVPGRLLKYQWLEKTLEE